MNSNTNVPNASSSALSYKPLEEYFILDGAAVSLRCVESGGRYFNDSDDNASKNSDTTIEKPKNLSCCNIKMHVIDKKSSGRTVSKFINEQYVRLHRVQRYDGTTTQVVTTTMNNSLNLRQNRLAYGDIVYIECGKGDKVLRGNSITGKAKWKNSNFHNNKKSRKDTKSHFCIVGNFAEGNLVTESSKFELQSVHWKDCHVGIRNDNGTAMITNCTRDPEKVSKLTLCAKPLPGQPVRKPLVKKQRRIKTCSHGYTRLAHRLACSSYLDQSSSGVSTSGHTGFSGSADIDVVLTR